MNGRKLKILRIEAGLTQKTLAERLGVREQKITWWETNRSSMTTSEVVDISRVLGIEPSTLDPNRFALPYKD